MTFANMDVIEVEAFSCLKQSITWRIIFEVGQQNQSPIDWHVIDWVIDYFNPWAPIPNQYLRILVQQLAQNVRDSQQ